MLTDAFIWNAVATVVVDTNIASAAIAIAAAHNECSWLKFIRHDMQLVLLTVGECYAALVEAAPMLEIKGIPSTRPVIDW